MKMKLLAAIAAAGGMLFGSSAYAVSCPSSSPTLLGTVPFTCTDAADTDLTFTFDGSTGLPSDTTFSLTEVDSGGLDVYAVNLFFPSGYTGSGTFTYDLTVIPSTDEIVAANLSTTIPEASNAHGWIVTKTITDANGGPVLGLTSTDGSHDPTSGETPFPTPETTIHVVDASTPGVGIAHWDSWANSFEVQRRLAPEPATLALLGLGLLGMAAFRKRRD